MKIFALTSAGISLAVAVLAATLPPIDILYDHAGLTRVTITNKTLKYVTHSLKTNLVVVRQDMSSYDRHEAVAQLTEQDKNAVIAWIQTNEWPRIAKSYPSSKPGSYGTTFRSVLDIKLSGVHHQATWDGTSDCPEINKAIEKLESICTIIIQNRKTSAEPPVRGDGKPATQP